LIDSLFETFVCLKWAGHNNQQRLLEKQQIQTGRDSAFCNVAWECMSNNVLYRVSKSLMRNFKAAEGGQLPKLVAG
jgi:hypothetical protein